MQKNLPVLVLGLPKGMENRGYNWLINKSIRLASWSRLGW